MLFLLTAPLGGLLYRMRGGFLTAGWGNTPSRLLWSVATGIILALAAQSWNLLATIPFFFLSVLDGWKGAADLGRDSDRPAWKEWAILALRGLELTAIPGLLFWALGYHVAFIFCGLALPLLYELGHRTPTWRTPGFNRGVEIAEVYTGTYLWFCAILTVSILPRWYVLVPWL